MEDRPHEEDTRERLRRMRSADLASSTNALKRANSMPGQISHVSHGSKDGFRKIGFAGLAFDELENTAPSAVLPTNPGEPATVRSPTGSRLGGRYAPFRRMRSGERWRAGGGWFTERSRERDKEREKEDRARMMGNWI